MAIWRICSFNGNGLVIKICFFIILFGWRFDGSDDFTRISMKIDAQWILIIPQNIQDFDYCNYFYLIIFLVTYMMLKGWSWNRNSLFYSRGPIRNLIDILDLQFCGLLRPNRIDWMNLYSLPGQNTPSLGKMNFGVSRENYQFVWCN